MIENRNEFSDEKKRTVGGQRDSCCFLGVQTHLVGKLGST